MISGLGAGVGLVFFGWIAKNSSIETSWIMAAILALALIPIYLMARGKELKYPPNWNVLGPYGGDYNDLCTENPQNKPIIIFSIEKPEYCGFVGEFLPPGEANLTIVTGSKYETLEGIVSDNYEKITLSGENAVKYPFTETSDLPNVQATRIYLNHNSRGYLIFIKQIDKKGNYEPLFNQILSTFKFFD